MKEFENSGYWALVLGGSSGLGLAAAKKLALHGMNICVVHRSPRMQQESNQAHFDEIRNLGVEFMEFNADAVSRDKRTAIISTLKSQLHPNGKIRCLIHSIAKGNLKPMDGDHALTGEDFLVTLHAMAVSLYEWTKVVFEAGLFANDSRIIAFTSEGSSKAWKYYGAVSAAKASLEAISRNIALEFAVHGITSNCIQAGITDTAAMRMIPGSSEIITNTLLRNPNKRLTTAADVAAVVYLLARDEAAWINGSILMANGGEHLQ